jgi:hypothetical protein
MRAAIQSQRGGDVESTSPRSGFAMRFQKSRPAGAVPVLPGRVRVYVVGAAEDQNSEIHVRLFVSLLPLYSQWGSERTKQQLPEGKRPAWPVVRGLVRKYSCGILFAHFPNIFYKTCTMGSINSAYSPRSNRSINTSTGQVPSAPSAIKAIEYAAQIDFWYHLTRI